MNSIKFAAEDIVCPHCKRTFEGTLLHSHPERTPTAAIVLSLDGGGIRGYTSLLILRELMTEIEYLEKREGDLNDEELKALKPSIYFDYIVGTSTGGLIAIMLSRLQMTVEECIEEYKKLCPKLFGAPRLFHVRGGFLLWDRPKFSRKVYRDIISNVVKSRASADNTSPDGSGPWEEFKQQDVCTNGKERPVDIPEQCKTAVVAFKDERLQNGPFLFRSYNHPRVREGELTSALNPGLASTRKITQVAEATSAAPSYFHHVSFENEDATYLDGGLTANNPASIAWQEAWEMARLNNKNISPGAAVGCVISIGTGKSVWRFFSKKGTVPVISPASKYLHMLSTQRKILTDTEKIHEDMYVHSVAHCIPYHRFNVLVGLENVALDTYNKSTMKLLEDVTRKYLDGEEHAIKNLGPATAVRENLRSYAELLVKYRRRPERRNRLPYALQNQMPVSSRQSRLAEVAQEPPTGRAAPPRESSVATRYEYSMSTDVTVSEPPVEVVEDEKSWLLRKLKSFSSPFNKAASRQPTIEVTA